MWYSVGVKTPSTIYQSCLSPPREKGCGGFGRLLLCLSLTSHQQLWSYGDGPQLKVSFDRLVMLQRIKPTTSGLQGEWFIHYTMVAPTVWGGGRGGGGGYCCNGSSTIVCIFDSQRDKCGSMGRDFGGVYCILDRSVCVLCVCGGEGWGGAIAFGMYSVYVLVNEAFFLNSSSYEQVNGFWPNLHKNTVGGGGGGGILVTLT